MAKFKHNGVKISNNTDRKSIEDTTDAVLLQIKDYIVNQIDGKQANKLLYWLNDWSAYILPKEKTFDYDSLIKYEQYSIFEANFGFKVGSEAGGLHYGVIIDKDNVKSSKIVMVIPFKSLDEGETEEDIDQKTEVYLGDKVFAVQVERYRDELEKIENKLKTIDKSNEKYLKLDGLKNYYTSEIKKLSKGTIAQVGQMCLMSKMRIYYPTNSSEKLFGIKLSEPNIKKIKDKFNEIYF